MLLPLGIILDASGELGIQLKKDRPKVLYVFYRRLDLICWRFKLWLFNNAWTLFVVLQPSRQKGEQGENQVVKNLSNGLACQLSKDLGYSLTHNLGRYLCQVSYFARSSQQNHLWSGYWKIQSKAEWVASDVSFHGWRGSMIQSVLGPIPNYTMQTTRLPTALYGNLEKTSRDFLWGSTQEDSKNFFLWARRVFASLRVRGAWIWAVKATKWDLFNESWGGIFYQNLELRLFGQSITWTTPIW